MHPRRTSAAVLATALLLAAALLPAGGAGAQDADDTVFIEKDDEGLSNADLSVRLSEATAFDDVQRVLVARDDDFADALASGVMQADAPLLLISRDGVQDVVADHLAALAPQEVVVLGGEGAVPEAVADELRADGYDVSRRQGPSRFETATAIAGTEAADATEAILVRAFPSEDAEDPTQAFADSLAAGGWAADMGFPVLLTQSEVLTGSTRSYLAQSQIRTVHIVGGTAAVSSAVEQELLAMDLVVDRVAGAARADTALEVAKARGAETAADVARVTLIDGESPDAWAGGFAAAAHSAMFDAPIVLGRDNGLPQVTADFLAAGAPSQAQGFAGVPVDPQGIRLTCVIDADICRTARDLLGLDPLDEPVGELLVEGTCPTFADAQLSRDGTTVVVPVEAGCGPIPADGPSLAFVDATTGAVDVVAVPVPDLSPPITLTAAGDGSVAGLTVEGDPVTAWVVRRDGDVSSINEVLGVRHAGGAERSMTADGGSYLLFLRTDTTCVANCFHRYDVAAGQADPLAFCGGVDGVTECSSAVVSPGGGHVAHAGRGDNVPWTAIRVDTGDTQTVPLPPEAGTCRSVDVAGSGEGLFDCDGQALLVDFGAGDVVELPVSGPRAWSGDGSVVAATGAVLRLADGTVGDIGVADAQPWVSDVGTGLVAAPDGLRVFAVRDVLDAG